MGTFNPQPYLIKSFNKANNLNKSDYLRLPDDKATFIKYQKDASKLARKQLAKFVNKADGHSTYKW